MRRRRIGRKSESTRAVNTVLTDPHSGVDFHVNAARRLIRERTENIRADNALLVPPSGSRRRILAAASKHPAAGHRGRPKGLAERALSLPEGAIIRASTTLGERIENALIPGTTMRVVMTDGGDVYYGPHDDDAARFREGLRLLAGRPAIEEHFGVRIPTKRRRAED